jgi:hypothetical protein
MNVCIVEGDACSLVCIHHLQPAGVSNHGRAGGGRFPVHDDDFDIAVKAYEWPRKMVEIMKEAGAKANSEHKEFESALKLRRKEFSELLDRYQAEVGGWEQKIDIIRREQNAQEVLLLGDTPLRQRLCGNMLLVGK